MKLFSISLLTFSTCLTAQAKDLRLDDENFLKQVSEEERVNTYNQEMKVAYLSKILVRQQKSYEDKISFLETELRKTKDRLIEKSLAQQKREETLRDAYSAENTYLKRELAYTTKSLMEYQRQIEKMKPSEDLKNMIKLNTQLASELRRSEDQIAIIQLKKIENTPGAQIINRLPASVPNQK